MHVRLLRDALPPVTHLNETIAELLREFRELRLAASALINGLDGMATVVGKTLLVLVPFVDQVSTAS